MALPLVSCCLPHRKIKIHLENLKAKITKAKSAFGNIFPNTFQQMPTFLKNFDSKDKRDTNTGG